MNYDRNEFHEDIECAEKAHDSLLCSLLFLERVEVNHDSLLDSLLFQG